MKKQVLYMKEQQKMTFAYQMEIIKTLHLCRLSIKRKAINQIYVL